MTRTPESKRVYVVGDIHGQMERLAAILYSANLVSEKGAWIGGTADLIFVGDFFDRGPYAIEALDFVMALQAEATLQGGTVDALLGNHDLLALGSILFRGSFLINHHRNGGTTKDLRRVTSEHATWLTTRPAMYRFGQNLVVHADTNRYLKYGRTVTQVNRRVADILLKPDEAIWNQLLEDLSDRHRFDETVENGMTRLVPFLATFGASILIHGHTPITYVTGRPPETITRPFVYGDGRAINVDGGLYLGGPGFLYEMEIPGSASTLFHAG